MNRLPGPIPAGGRLGRGTYKSWEGKREGDTGVPFASIVQRRRFPGPSTLCRLDPHPRLPSSPTPAVCELPVSSRPPAPPPPTSQTGIDALSLLRKGSARHPAGEQTRCGAAAGAGAIPGAAADADTARPRRISAPDSPAPCLSDLDGEMGESPLLPPPTPRCWLRKLASWGEVFWGPQLSLCTLEAAGMTKELCVWEELPQRSEERRVGKECRSRWSPYH